MRTFIPSARRSRFFAAAAAVAFGVGEELDVDHGLASPLPAIGRRPRPAEVGVLAPLAPALDLAAHPDAVGEAAPEGAVDGVGQLADRVGRVAGVVEFGVAEVERRLAHSPDSISRRRHAVTRPGRAACHAPSIRIVPPGGVSVSSSAARGAAKSSPSTGRPRWRRSSSSWRSGRSSWRRRAPASCSKRAVDAVEPLLDRVDLVGVLAPLARELAEQLQDLVARLLDHEVVERLADDAEEGEQRERRAQHHLLAHRLVEERGVVLVDEPGELSRSGMNSST